MKDQEVMLLRDPQVEPDGKGLKEALGENVFVLYKEFTDTIVKELGMAYEWRYYNDGKAWLCKASYKKKTVFWLSVWECFFRTSFFFTEKHTDAVMALDIADIIKENFAAAKPSGRLIPMLIDVTDSTVLKDMYTLIRFKKSLK